MSKMYSIDVMDVIRTRLRDNINTQLTILLAERTETWLPANLKEFATTSIIDGQSRSETKPRLIISLNSTEILDEIASIYYDNAVDIHSFSILLSIDCIEPEISDRLREVYILAIIRCMHEYSYAGIEWIRCKSVERYDDINNFSYKHASIEIEVRIN